MKSIKPGGQNHHQRHKNQIMKTCVSSLLLTLKKKSQKLSWINVLEGDGIQRLETVHGGLILKITYISPREGKLSHSTFLFKDRPFVYGERGEEYRLEINDRLRTYGRASILQEWFGPKSPLFKEIEEVFRKIESETRPAQTSNTVDRMNLPQCVREIDKVLASL